MIVFAKSAIWIKYWMVCYLFIIKIVLIGIMSGMDFWNKAVYFIVYWNEFKNLNQSYYLFHLITKKTFKCQDTRKYRCWIGSEIDIYTSMKNKWIDMNNIGINENTFHALKFQNVNLYERTIKLEIESMYKLKNCSFSSILP